MKRTLIFIFISIIFFYTVVASAQSFEGYKCQQQAKFNGYAQKRPEEFRAYEKPRMCVDEFQHRTHLLQACDSKTLSGSKGEGGSEETWCDLE